MAVQVRIAVGGHRLLVRASAASTLDSVEIAQGRRVVTAKVVDERRRPVPFSESFWFAVSAFLPKAALERG